MKMINLKVLYMLFALKNSAFIVRKDNLESLLDSFFKTKLELNQIVWEGLLQEFMKGFNFHLNITEHRTFFKPKCYSYELPKDEGFIDYLERIVNGELKKIINDEEILNKYYLARIIGELEEESAIIIFSDGSLRITEKGCEWIDSALLSNDFESMVNDSWKEKIL